MKTLLPQVAIVGRANVGKSTLFNRLIEKNKALVSTIAGTTRDRNIDKVNWQGNQFILVDTGGLDVDNKNNVIDAGIVKQAKQAIGEADLVLFVYDAKVGILPQDRELAKDLIKSGLKNKILLVGNKADSLRLRGIETDVYKLGLGEPSMLSAANGSGCGDLLDIIVDRLPRVRKPKVIKRADQIKIAIVGKPNVGKSSLLNSILGEDRVIVTDIAHTTREAHDLEFEYQNQQFILIDTAGIRRKNKINNETLEKQSIMKSLSAIKEADVVMLVTEVQKKIDAQDKKITQAILEAGKPLLIVANKWDLIPEKETNTIKDYENYYQKHFPYLWWAPMIFTSALENQRTKNILNLVLKVDKAKKIKLTKKQLELFLKSQIKQHRPSRGKGLKNPYIYEIEQVKINPPRFVMYVNEPTILHFSYIRFIQNNLRKRFGIIGTPIQIEIKKWAEHQRQQAKQADKLVKKKK